MLLLPYRRFFTTNLMPISIKKRRWAPDDRAVGFYIYQEKSPASCRTSVFSVKGNCPPLSDGINHKDKSIFDKEV